ncbi:MAG: competence/damage-inducible protein A [Gorillibacterium sp.]|nr:competence/damage-inducible protein A [Gorillibacterium sp.]
MRAELIAVGTELLLGQIANTNGQFLAQHCAGMGIDVYFQTVVGDNPDRLKEALILAAGRADLIICTGGLGPTQDDLTKDVLGELFGRKLVIHQPSLDTMAGFFRERNAVMVDSNLRQALMLEGSYPLQNDTGLAVGIGLSEKGTHYILLPGPPREMKPMFQGYAVPWLRNLMTDEEPLFSKMLKFSGIGESNLEHALLDMIKEQTDPTIAPYAKEGEVTIRLTTRAKTQAEAYLKMEVVEAEIHRRVGQYLYAEEDVTIEQVVYRLLQEKKVTLSAAESCTGGLLADLLTTIPGSSTMFRGGVVSYSNELKASLLGVPISLLEGEGAPGAVSAQTAKAMAEGMLAVAETDYAISVTGVAGPDPSEGKPVGLVFFAVACKGRPTEVIESRFSGNRETIKLKAAKSALYLLWVRLNV